MLTINLLPPSKRCVNWPIEKLALAITLFFATIFSSVFAYNTYRIWSLEQQIATLNQQYELLRPTEDNMRLTSAEQSHIDKKNAILLSLTGERKTWSAILAHFGMITPPQIWLTELSGGDKNVLLIKGNALTYPDLAKFITLLEQDEFFGEPALIKAEQDNRYLYTKFEMTVKLKGIQP